MKKIVKKSKIVIKIDSSGVGGGSGWVAVVPVDSLGHCAHFGGNFIEIGAVLTEIWVF
jgi:hypothetical protein